jgi:hypothetical protein
MAVPTDFEGDVLGVFASAARVELGRDSRDGWHTAAGARCRQIESDGDDIDSGQVRNSVFPTYIGWLRPNSSVSDYSQHFARFVIRGFVKKRGSIPLPVTGCLGNTPTLISRGRCIASKSA